MFSLRRRLLLAVSIGACFVVSCSSSEGSTDPGQSNEVTAPPTNHTAATATDPIEEFCQGAEASIGAEDPPETLEEVAEDAQRIVDLATTAPAEITWLSEVRSGAEALVVAAQSQDPAEVADAATTLSAAYDQLDITAAEIELAPCSSEAWGRQVAIAAIDLVGAGG